MGTGDGMNSVPRSHYLLVKGEMLRLVAVQFIGLVLLTMPNLPSKLALQNKFGGCNQYLCFCFHTRHIRVVIEKRLMFS